MGKLHENWKGFKKKHPSFEKAKKRQADLGKQLDNYENAMRAMCVHFRGVSPHVSTAMSALININKIVKEYATVVDELQKGEDRKIKSDFDDLRLGQADLMKRLEEVKEMGLMAAKYQTDP